jgi:hypothetical protein
LYYDRLTLQERDIWLSKEYKSVKEITIPTAYIIPKGFDNIMDLLKATKSHLASKNDTLIEVESYKTDYKPCKSAYEGHYP